MNLLIILFDAVSKQRVTDYGTNNAYPDGVPDNMIDFPAVAAQYGVAETNLLTYRLHDVTDKVKVEAIMQAATVEAVIAAGAVSDVTIYKRISASSDKLEIVADGTDTATITATVDDPASTEPIEFYDGTGTLIQTVACVNGQAQLPVTATVPGDIIVVAKSTTKYGQNQVSVKAV